VCAFVQVRQRVDEVLAQVDMTERFADLVGTPGLSGLSTEARKRLTIAVELMANAPVLFMDEPTSGNLSYRLRHDGFWEACCSCCTRGKPGSLHSWKVCKPACVPHCVV
jgi:ABC-type thiamine transport system ATPase subunit